MIHEEMIEQVSDELRNTTIQSKITRWLNMSIIEIATQYVFGHLNKYGTKNTVVGNPDIELDSDFLWPKSIQIPADRTKLDPLFDEGKLSESNPDYRTLQGTVSHYYINGTQLGLWHVPSSIKVITYNYQKRPNKLLANFSVTCDLPEEWHQLATQKATTKGYDYESNSEGSAKSLTQESRILFRLGASAYKRPDASLILGGNTYRNKPPRPRLPSHYPS